MKLKPIVWMLLLILGADCAFGQQPAQKSKESIKFRTLLTLAGGGGGFTLGVLGGIGAYEHSVNSDRKVWTLAIVVGAAGAVGGYFLGRAIDKRHNSKDITWAPDGIHNVFDRSVTQVLPAEKLPSMSRLSFLKMSDGDGCLGPIEQKGLAATENVDF